MLNSSIVLTQFKKNWQTFESETIDGICRELGMTWRERVLDPCRTVQLFLLQVAYGNTACTHLRHLANLNFSAAAYCRARKRIALSVFERLLERLNERSRADAGSQRRWNGHRVYFVDGSTFTMPDTQELKRHFGQPTGQEKSGGFPVAHFLALLHQGTGLIKKVVPGPLFTHDLANAYRLHPQLQKDDVLLADRAFCSFAHIALLARSGIHAVMRLHQMRPQNIKRKTFANKQTVRLVKAIGRKDQLLAWLKPGSCPKWMSQKDYAMMPCQLLVRQLTYGVSPRGFRTTQVVVVTTLLCPKEYPLEAVSNLYGQRWQIETNLRHLKTTMGMDQVHCKTVAGVLKELMAFCVVYNLIRLVMLQAAHAQGLAPERISFVDPLRWLVSASGTQLVPLVVIPLRKNRFEPRLVKRRPKQYKLLRLPRQEAKAQLTGCLAA
jgi:hypothetical protein